MPSNSKALFTPSQPYIFFVAVEPVKLALTNSIEPPGARVIAAPTDMVVQ